MNMLAVAWRHESGLGNSRDEDIQVSGQHCPWPHRPPREMAALMTQSGAAPVVGTMAFAKLLQQDLQTVLLSNLMDFLSHSFPSLCPALGDTEHDAALRTDLMSRKKRPSAWFCLPRLWIFSKLPLFPEFTFPREEQLQEIVSVKSPGKKTVMRYRSNLQKRCESLLLQWALPKGN